jgi:hypothetical protein
MRDCLPRLEYRAYLDHGSASALQTSSFYFILRPQRWIGTECLCLAPALGGTAGMPSQY